jgi:lipopolysaccharide transport system permease protein
LLAVGRPLSWHAVLAVPGFLLVASNVLWMMLVLGVVCARYRDMAQIVQNVLQVVFYLTPLIWTPQTLPGDAHRLVLDFNPFFHLISLVRAPLLGEIPAAVSWFVATTAAVGGWVAALHFYAHYRHRIPYWL